MRPKPTYTLSLLHNRIYVTHPRSGHESSEFVGRALQRTAERGCPYMNSLGANYFGVAGVVALGFGCLAMIWSLILS